MTPDQGAVLLKALDQARVPTDANDHQVEAYAASGADALVHIAEGFLAAAGGDAHTADRYQMRVSVSAQTLRKHRMSYPQPNPASPESGVGCAQPRAGTAGVAADGAAALGRRDAGDGARFGVADAAEAKRFASQLCLCFD